MDGGGGVGQRNVSKGNRQNFRKSSTLNLCCPHDSPQSQPGEKFLWIVLFSSASLAPGDTKAPLRLGIMASSGGSNFGAITHMVGGNS